MFADGAVHTSIVFTRYMDSFQLISYFAERKISEDVLQRNAVMQISGNQVSS